MRKELRFCLSTDFFLQQILPCVFCISYSHFLPFYLSEGSRVLGLEVSLVLLRYLWGKLCLTLRKSFKILVSQFPYCIN